MGLKHEARALAISAQVPCLPGSEVITSLAEGLAAAEKIGYPVMIKSSGGGGGMGMVDCKTKLEFEQNFESVVSQSKVS